MVATPWGKSESLRKRKLRPGPGVPREEVVANQRERLFGAVVACVSERGYAATTVVDLLEVSGVSSRTFYDLFPDKKACFLATLEAMIQAAVAFAAQSAGTALDEKRPGGVNLPTPTDEDPETWEEHARRGFDVFAEMVVSQPAAARLALVEAYAAGPEAMIPIENATAGFEWLTRQTIELSPERVGMPADMIAAHIGSQQEITRTRLREGKESELPELMDESFKLMLSYRPPSEPLRTVGRLTKFLPEQIEAHDHAERALRAFAAVVAENGYVETTVDEVLSRAQMSATTFYANFHGKEDAMLAAIDSAAAQLVAAVLPAYRRAADWPDGIRAAFGALCTFLASRPSLARLLMVEVYAAGPAVVQRRLETLSPLEQLLAEGSERSPDTPKIAAEAILGGLYTLAYKRIRDSGPEAMPGLAPVLTYIALSPFIGAEDAVRVANGAGHARPAS